MLRPIDAYALRNKKKKAIINTHERYGCEVVEYIEIINAPTLDYKDLVPQGEWTTTDTVLGRCCVCSVCGSCPSMEYRFCPYCGARMVSK